MFCKKTITSMQENAGTISGPVMLLLYSRSDEFIARLASSLQLAAERLGYSLNTVDSLDNSRLQIEQVKEARERGEKGIIVNLVDPDSAKEVLEAAGDMKVVFINRAPSDLSLLNENAIYVGSDERLAGRLQGEWLANYFKARNKDSIKYLLLEGTPGLPNTIQRTEAVLQALADAGIEATPAAPPIVANYKRNEALFNIYPILSSGVEFDTIIANNDAMALGAIEALQFLDMSPTKTPVVGIDATFPAFLAIREGKLAMTVFQDAQAQGNTAIIALANMINGEPIDKGTGFKTSPDNPYIIWIPFEPVTRNQVPRNLDYSSPIM